MATEVTVIAAILHIIEQVSKLFDQVGGQLDCCSRRDAAWPTFAQWLCCCFAFNRHSLDIP